MDKKIELNRLKIRLQELRLITSMGFKTDEELDDYFRKNESSYDEYNKVYKQIQALEWELMTPEQQARQSDVSAKIKAKTGQNNNS